MPTLFDEIISEPKIIMGANFSEDGKHRYALWRIWDESKPLVMLIGLNPSTANAETNDQTIESVVRLSRFNGYGGFYMMNCWSYIATEPKFLNTAENNSENIGWLLEVSKRCKDVVFAWGNFQIVRGHLKDSLMKSMFPGALCITKNLNGSPGHPLYKKGTITFKPYQKMPTQYTPEERLRIYKHEILW